MNILERLILGPERTREKVVVRAVGSPKRVSIAAVNAISTPITRASTAASQTYVGYFLAGTKRVSAESWERRFLRGFLRGLS